MKQKTYKLTQTQFNFFKRLIWFIKKGKALTLGMQRTAIELFEQLR